MTWHVVCLSVSSVHGLVLSECLLVVSSYTFARGSLRKPVASSYTRKRLSPLLSYTRKRLSPLFTHAEASVSSPHTRGSVSLLSSYMRTRLCPLLVHADASPSSTHTNSPAPPRGPDARYELLCPAKHEIVRLGSLAGPYTRPLLTSTYAVLVSEPLCVQVVKYSSHDPSIYRRYPTYPTKSANVEVRSGGV